MKSEKRIVAIYLSLCDRFPSFRKTTHRWLYETMARNVRQEAWTFMNYGYACADQDPIPALEPVDEPYRLSYQLYHQLVRNVPLAHKSVLEVGSGRGGGASMLHKYMVPARMTGLDYSREAVQLCRNHYPASGLEFIQGDAEHLPLPDESYDVILNVESSHCYGSVPAFLNEATRVLKPGGTFLLTDLRPRKDLPELREHLSSSRLTVLEEREITDRVVQALEMDHDNRLQTIRNHIPKAFLGPFTEFAGVEGSTVLNNLRSGNSVYVSFHCRKP